MAATAITQAHGQLRLHSRTTSPSLPSKLTQFPTSLKCGSHGLSKPGALRGAPLVRSAVEHTSSPSPTVGIQAEELIPYTPGPLDDVFLKIFRGKMSEEVGWDSSKPGYDGLVDIAKRLLLQYRSGEETERATVRVLRSLFPSWLLPLYKQLVAPLGDGKYSAMLCAQVTLATCQWLMGKCTINEVELADGSKIPSGVRVQKCKYLDETKCAGICIHTCKLPTQAFMYGDMGVRLLMEPNYEDFSCQFNFGVDPPPAAEDPALKTPCLAVCPTAASRGSIRGVPTEPQCPQVAANI
ncbi:hypothetical protein KC19_3G225700 [Ceratodon purpureus]|uniref:Beta-carotene isomerase D27-like C-terminal domain-containing protein n=1 Tax=Ceratodon purpureus TaxID=3225 RepID=A0A8T0ILK2_CERPU|nr:hypothetical protein KC19_3G225700 [Ceratodon purpureus]